MPFPLDPNASGRRTHGDPIMAALAATVAHRVDVRPTRGPDVDMDAPDPADVAAIADMNAAAAELAEEFFAWWTSDSAAIVAAAIRDDYLRS